MTNLLLLLHYSLLYSCKAALVIMDRITHSRDRPTDISYISRVIADFVPIFVAMATVVIRG